MSMNKSLFSSASGEWATPIEFYDKLDQEFGFNLDPCCTRANQKAPMGFCNDLGIDGLSKPWISPYIQKVFVNPPYGDPEHPCKPVCKKKICKKRGFCIEEYVPGIINWVVKCYYESRKLDHGGAIVALLPARTDTKWFHRYIYGKAEIRFIKGRLKFGGSKNSAPFPSIVCIWRREY